MKTYQSVIDKINLVRKEFSLIQLEDLPRGIRASESCCPIGRAFEEIDQDVRVNPDNIEFVNLTPEQISLVANALGDVDFDPEYHNWVAFPDDIIDFIDKFDNGKYPELVK